MIDLARLPDALPLRTPASRTPIVRSIRLLALWCALLLGTAPVRAASLDGFVVGVADGDTVTMIDVDKTQYRVRLAGIDAPEKRQAYGARARQALASAVFQKTVLLEWHKRDRYGRLVGKILVNGHDVALSLVRDGLAWHYKDFEKEQSIADRLDYASAELRARELRVGLWSDSNPEPPWMFRRNARSK